MPIHEYTLIALLFTLLLLKAEDTYPHKVDLSVSRVYGFMTVKRVSIVLSGALNR
jgi:hypothetical protein